MVGREKKEGCKAMPTWRQANRTRNYSSEENEMEKRWRGSVWMGMFGWDEYPLMEVEVVGVTVGLWSPQGTAGWDERCPSHRLGHRYPGSTASVWLESSANKSFLGFCSVCLVAVNEQICQRDESGEN